MSDVAIHVASSASLVGREAQLADLRQAFEAARSGDPVTVLVGGEAGIGKTRLAEEFAAEMVRDGARAVVGHSVPLDGEGPAFAPIVGVVRGLHAEFGTARLLELAGPGGEALASLVPELGAAPADGREGRGRLYEVVTSLLERVAAEQPLVVVIEDLQWADSPTRDLLRFVVRGVRDAQLTILATYRTDELGRGHPLRQLLAELDRLRQVHRIELPRLALDDVVVQLYGILGRAPERGHVERIYQRSEGIPFFVEELAHVGDDGGSELPESLRDLLLVRVEPLSEDTQRLLRLMSAAGNRVDHAVLAEVADEHAGPLDGALREAISAGVIVVDGDGYAFRHALLREALHDDMLPGEHARMHARYAQVLEERPELMPNSPTAVEVAHHWYSAHDVERAFAWSLTAADELVRGFAHATAQQMLERALELWDQVADPQAVAGADRVDLLVRAAREAQFAGEFERALPLVKEALRLVDREAEPARAGWLLAHQGNVLNRLGRPGAVDALLQARELIPAHPPSAQRAEMLDWLATMLMLAWRFEESVEVAEDAMRVAEAVGMANVVASARITRGSSWLHLGRAEDALAEMRDTVAGVTDDLPLHRYYVNLSDVYMLLGRYGEAADLAMQGYEDAKKRGRKRTTGSVLAGNAAEPILALGDWERAERLITRGLELDLPPNHERHMIALRAWLALWRGDVASAAEAADTLRGGMLRRSVLPQDSRMVHRLTVDVALAEGNPEAAWQVVVDALDASAAADGPRVNMASYDLPLAFAGAQALGALIRVEGDAGYAVEVGWLRELVARESEGWPVQVWSALVEAELAGQAGNDPAAWRKALDVLSEAEGPVLLGPYASYRLGQALIEAGERDAARDVLRRAAGVADELGAQLIRERIDELSRRAHIPLVQGLPPAPASSLTAREQEVLRLVAEGRSNREIGELLFISSKTASVHVSNILAKLGVAGRGEAAAMAHREGLLDNAAS